MLAAFAILAACLGSVPADPFAGAPVRPGDPERGVPFWNGESARFLYPPAFDFKAPPARRNIRNYRFRVYDREMRLHEFKAEKPWASLAPVWEELPEGQVTVTCESMMQDDTAFTLAGTRVFWKSDRFMGGVPSAKRSYGVAARMAYDYVFNRPGTRYFREKGRPDPADQLNGLVSKTFGAMVSAMVRYADLAPDRRDEALDLARRYGDYLLATSEPADAPLAYWPQTYTTNGGQRCVASDRVGTIMLIYPATVGGHYLALAKATGETKWRDAAERIAATYLKVRRADGTWPLVLRTADGLAARPNTLVPDALIPFFEKLHAVTGKDEYHKVADACFAWIDAHPMKDWHWEGQFEDQVSLYPYQDLQFHNALAVMLHIIERYPDDPRRLSEARDLLRYGEDQFVYWTKPFDPEHGTYPELKVPEYSHGYPSAWECPCVVEQYACHYPVSSSAAKFISAFLAMGRSRAGHPLDLLKAKTLANQMTRVQMDDGLIPTWWHKHVPEEEWINCHISSAGVLHEMHKAEENGVFAQISEFGLQDLIDAAAAKGGGRVTVGPGRHLTGQLELRSNVELHLEEGAVLEGLPGRENYRTFCLPYSEGDWSAVVVGENVTNVAITGKGEIFGNGSAWPQPDDQGNNQEGTRPRGIVFANCRDVRLSDFTLRDSACWGLVLKCCEDVTARRVRIDSHANSNNDGFDIEAKNVLIEDCDVDSGDDAYCLKSNDPGFEVENVTVRNCIGRSHCNVFKLGTASHGTMRNIRFERCRAEAPRRDFEDRRLREPGRMWFRSRRRPELGYPEGVGISAISIENVDGGTVEDVVFSDIEVSGTVVPFFIRGGMRFGRSCGTPPSDRYVLRNLTLSGIHGTCEGPIAASVSGVEGCRPTGVVLRDIDIECRGAGRVASEIALKMPVTCNPSGYPEATQSFAPSILPAYGLYVDRADDIEMNDVSFRLKDGTEDVRPPVCVTDKVK